MTSPLMNWKPAGDPKGALSWLDGEEDALTGYWAPPGFEDSTWILHAMYRNESLLGFGSHDDVEKEAIRRGLRQPDVVAGLDLTAATVDSGTPLGWVEQPSLAWARLRWREYFGPTMDAELAGRSLPPNDRALRRGRPWSTSIFAPPEGSLDEVSLAALVEVLASTTDAVASSITAFYGQVPANNYESPTLFAGHLPAIRELVDRFNATPSNLWPANRSWFVMTGYDLTATCVWGSPSFVDSLRSHPDLETFEWTRPQI